MAFYRLADDVSYRRESFGALLMTRRDRLTRFFNTTASRVLESCSYFRSPTEIAFWSGLTSSQEMHTLRGFLDGLAQREVLVQSSRPSPEPSKARIFFTDVGQFPTGHLYAPLGVEIELTLRCARRCVYCAYDSSPSVETIGELDVDEWGAILSSLKDKGVLYVRFTGGDPMIRRDFHAILSIADQLELIITVGSDLTVLKDEHVTSLAETQNLLTVQTTLDGASAETADLLRGDGNFQRVMAGIRRLSERHIPVVVGSVVTCHNFDEVKSIGQLVAAWGASGYWISPLYAAGRGNDVEALIPTNEQMAEANAQFGALVSEGVIAAADPSWSALTSKVGSGQLTSMWDDQSSFVRAPERLMRLDSSGRCYTSIQLKDRLGEEAFVGSIREDDLLTLWHESPLLGTLRALGDEKTYFGPMLDIRGMKARPVATEGVIG